MYYIYKIVCLMNNKVYIGRTTNYKTRFSDHRMRLRRNIHTNKVLQQDYNLYGSIKFSYDLIDTAYTEIDSIRLEDFWIDYYGGIESSDVYNCKNSKHNNEQMKLNVINSAKSNPNYGNKGRTFSEETRKKLSIARAGRVIPSWNKGKRGLYVTSEETKQKLSKALKGRKFTPEHRKHLSESRRLDNDNPNRLKYSKQIVEELRKTYNEVQNYNEVSRQFNINCTSVKNLIKYGRAYPSKEFIKKCNDYPEKEYNLSELEAPTNL